MGAPKLIDLVGSQVSCDKSTQLEHGSCDIKRWGSRLCYLGCSLARSLAALKFFAAAMLRRVLVDGGGGLSVCVFWIL